MTKKMTFYVNFYRLFQQIVFHQCGEGASTKVLTTFAPHRSEYREPLPPFDTDILIKFSTSIAQPAVAKGAAVPVEDPTGLNTGTRFRPSGCRALSTDSVKVKRGRGRPRKQPKPPEEPIPEVPGSAV